MKLTSHIWKKITDCRYHKGQVQRYDGPFVVKEWVGNVAYKFLLPEKLKIHPTFHVSFLKPYHEEDGLVQQRRGLCDKDRALQVGHLEASALDVGP